MTGNIPSSASYVDDFSFFSSSSLEYCPIDIMKSAKSSSWPLTSSAHAPKVSFQPPTVDLDELNQLLNEKIFPHYIEELKKEEYSYFFNSSQSSVKCDVRYVDKTKTVHIKCDRRVAKVLVDKFVQVEDKSPVSKAIVRLRCELTGTNNEAHITLVNNWATKNLLKSIGRLDLTERLKGNSGSMFFPVELKLFYREEREDYLLSVEGKVCEQIREKLGLKPLKWGHIHAGIVFPEDLEKLMAILKVMK